MQQPLQVNDLVTWTSVSNGQTVVRKGKVAAIVEGGNPPVALIQQIKLATRAQTELHGRVPRKKDSYLVLVPAESEGGSPTLYWPKQEMFKI